ncbi:hypothetical protein BKA66DRAFT_573143 [Pyrenochaeta sp. MPI-SDFR-AT-0127]|nr:hypothetical protein BKA66DRAFT_573143 [Pyrenochaeta sp. MPI-SDFR-AT-0127]
MAITAPTLVANEEVVNFFNRGGETVVKERKDVLEKLKGTILKPAGQGGPSPTQPPITATTAIDTVLKNGKLAVSQIILLQFLRALCIYTEDLPTSKVASSADEASSLSSKAAESFIGLVVSQITDPSVLPSQLLDRLVEISEELRNEKRTIYDSKALGTFRINVYCAQPLRSLRVVVHKREFKDSLPEPDVFNLAEAILSTMIDEDIDLCAPELPKRSLTRYKPAVENTASQEKLSNDAFEFIECVKALTRITESSVDVVSLYNDNYRSARQIAQAAKSTFVSDMEHLEMAEVTALRIHEAAERNDCWNEHLWLQLIESGRQNFVPMDPREPSKPEKQPGNKYGNLTDTFLLEDHDIEPAYSVTSLLAYFTDLMKMMQDTRVPGSAISLLNILSNRRPDLTKLELTQANAETLVPYISLVNEGIDTLIAPFFLVPSISTNIAPLGVGTIISVGGGSTIAQIMQAGPEIDESLQIEEWYRKKYTNAQLYGWMEKSLRIIYFQAYTMARAVASRTESAVNFEQGRKPAILRSGGYWDASRDGLLAADHLYLDLKRLETKHLESSPYDSEMTKTVSIRQVSPFALLWLRSTGSTVFSLDETLFDLDFPGHYMRHIRSVSVTIPAVVGAYNGVNATLTLLQHKYRTTTLVSSAEEYASTASSSSQNGFQTDHLPISSVAISSGTGDAGAFELAFNGPRYISDIVMRIQYTSVDGGARMRVFANASVKNAIKAVTESPKARNDGLWEMLDLRNDFVNEWYNFSTKMVAGYKGDVANMEVTMQLRNIKDRLPFWVRDQKELRVKGITLVGKDIKVIGNVKISAAGDTKMKEGEKVGVWRVCSWKG